MLQNNYDLFIDNITMIKKVFTCPVSQNIINVEIDQDKKEAWLSTSIDGNNMMAFFVLLRKCCNSLQKEKIATIVQTVLREDWDYLSENKKWTIVEESPTCVTISCKMNDALENIAKGFGL